MHFIVLPHDVLQHRAFLLDVVVRQCLPVFELLSLRRSIAAARDECLPCLGSLPSHGRWCHWPWTSNVIALPVNVLTRICMAPRNVSCSASEVTGCARDCDHAFGFLRLPRSEHLPPSGTPLDHSVSSMFFMLNVSAIWAR